MAALELGSLQRSILVLSNSLRGYQASPALQSGEPWINETLRAGIIQHFEVCYELCWKFMKRWIEVNVGSVQIDGVSRRELFRQAAESLLIDNVDLWMSFHQARNETSHLYDRPIADSVFNSAEPFLLEAEKLFVSLSLRDD